LVKIEQFFYINSMAMQFITNIIITTILFPRSQVKRRKRASKDGDTPKRGTIANMRSSVSSAADDADSADLRKRRGSEDILDGSGYNNNNNNNNGSDVQRRSQTGEKSQRQTGEKRQRENIKS
jgi:hypothetical protein